MYKPNWISSRQGETAEHNGNETYDARSPQNGVQWVELGIYRIATSKLVPLRAQEPGSEVFLKTAG